MFIPFVSNSFVSIIVNPAKEFRDQIINRHVVFSSGSDNLLSSWKRQERRLDGAMKMFRYAIARFWKFEIIKTTCLSANSIVWYGIAPCSEYFKISHFQFVMYQTAQLQHKAF